MTVGWARTLWRGLEIGLAGRLRHPHAAVTIDEVARSLEILYHGMGGALGRHVVGDAGSRRRAPFQAAGAMFDLMAWLDREQVHLPKAMDRYRTRALNRELYFWLAAYLAEEHELAQLRSLPLGVRHLLRGVGTSVRIQARFPALAQRYRRLCAAELEQRRSILPDWDAHSQHPVLALEAAIRYALGSADPPRDQWLLQALAAANRGDPPPEAWPRGKSTVLPFLPVTLWGHPGASAPGLRLLQLKRQTRRRPQGTRKTIARPHFDPARRPDPVEGAAAQGPWLYPEWQYQHRAYRAEWCAVWEQVPDDGASTRFDPMAVSLARQVRGQFEALRQLSGWNRHLDSGDELDLSAYVESVADARGCGRPSSRIYQERMPRWRDVAVAVLVDTSRSTEAWVGEQRVIAIARDSMLVLAEALAALREDFGLFAFASDSRLRVLCYPLKPFSERYDQSSRQRILALKPAQYTRMGAAIRHVGVRLEERSPTRKLLLVLTDGRPHDPVDGYEGRYALEDTRRALAELHARGIQCFGLTIDRRGAEYLPHLFGAGHYAVLSDARALPRVLPTLYARITARGPG
jgi:nitric oxide reductase NorD protein